jgi:asparagine synthase (glutamine-hydrolysing)
MRERRLADARSWGRSAILPEFAERIHLASLRFAEEQAFVELGFQVRKNALRMRCAIAQPGRSQGGQRWAELGSAFGLEVRDPTVDKRVMEYCFSVPNRFFSGPGNLDRFLLRHAMKGVIPTKILQNQSRGLQASDLARRLLSDSDNMEVALRELSDARRARNYLDYSKIDKVWRRCAELPQSAMVYNLAITILTRGMMAGIFLDQKI